MDLSKRIAEKMVALAKFVDDGIYVDANAQRLTIGDHVEVVGGRNHRGKTGTITQLKWFGSSYGVSGKAAEVTLANSTSHFYVEPTYLKKI